MNYNKQRKYVRRVCIHVNNTLNSQIEYWKGQKRHICDGKKMQWSSRRRNRWGWGICIRLNAPPNSGTSISTRQKKFYKHQSLKKIRERVRSLKWIIQTICIRCATV